MIKPILIRPNEVRGIVSMDEASAAVQAPTHLVVWAKIRKSKEVKVYSRRAENCRKFAAEMSPLLGFDVRPVSSAEEAVRDVDIILTATNSSVPVFDGRWLAPGGPGTTIGGGE